MLEVKQELLQTSYSGLSTGEFILVIKAVADGIEKHASFTGTCPDYVSKADKLREIAARLEVVDRAAAGGDRDKVAEKKSLREEAEQRLVFNATHLVMDSLHKKDGNLLHGAGYELKEKTNTRSTSTNHLPEIPENLRAKNGANPGELTIIVKRPQFFGSMDVQVNDGNPLAESDWRDAGKFYQCRVDLRGLEPVKKYYIRVRFENGSGTGPWSQGVSVVVL